MRRGHAMESRIADAYAAATGSTLVEVGSFPHPDHPWLFASPDRLVRTPGMAPRRFALLECKSVQRTASPPPPHFVVQCMLQLACAPTAPHVDLAQMDLKGTLVVHRIRRDAELMRFLVARLWDVWAVARRVFDGAVAAEDVFVDDVREFGRAELLDLKDIIRQSETVQLV